MSRINDRTARYMQLAKRPEGHVDATCFTTHEIELPPLQDDELMVDTLWMSVDPYQYVRMLGGPQGGTSYAVGDIPDAFLLGRVRETTSPAFQPGDLVLGQFGWQDRFIAPAAATIPLYPGFDLRPEEYLSVIGMPAFVGWTGMTQFVEMGAGKTIFVTGASGSVGSTVVQIALRNGLRVVASAGSDEKCAWLASLGDVRTINYRNTDNLEAALGHIAPEGIDFCFDNVGGATLTAAVNALRQHGHILVPGAISTFVRGDDPTTQMSDLRRLPMQCTTIHGYTVAEYFHKHAEFIDYMREWCGSGAGRPQMPITKFEGFESAPEALGSLFRQGSFGKTLVQIQ